MSILEDIKAHSAVDILLIKWQFSIDQILRKKGLHNNKYYCDIEIIIYM